MTYLMGVLMFMWSRDSPCSPDFSELEFNGSIRIPAKEVVAGAVMLSVGLFELVVSR